MKRLSALRISAGFKALPVLATLVLVLALAGTALASPASQPAILEDKGGPGPTLSFSYQGKLYEGGIPANGSYDFVVDLYSAQTTGTYIGNCINTSGVTLENYWVTDGLYHFFLVCGTNFDNHEIFSGSARWIQVKVRPGASTGAYTTLPRQAIAPAPYAWGFLPGTWVTGSAWGDGTDAGDALLSLQNTNTVGSALMLSSAGNYGLYSEVSSTGYAIYGNHLGTTGGLGLYGVTHGVGSGISGNAFSTGNGVWGNSYDGNGMSALTSRTDSNYGFYTPDNIQAANYVKEGAILQVVQNGGTEALELGDVVVIAGLGEPAKAGEAPIIQVSKADSAGSTAVIGVVYSTYSVEWLKPAEEFDPTGASGSGEKIPLATAGPVAPGEYLQVVVQGPCQVKASALDGAIQAGDLLSTASAGGKAAGVKTVTVDGATFALPGTVFGKALEPLPAGKEGLIYVFVTLQ